MSRLYFKLAVVLSAALIAAPVFAASNVRHTATPTTHKAAAKTPAKSSTKKTAKKTSTKRKPRLRGQQAIESSRVMEIQQALIREHYLNGDANGSWDSSTIAAMQKFQADQGWQTKLMPDSRALKKLGLGPDYSTAINAKDAKFTDPPPISSIPTEQASGFTAASGVKE